MPYPTQQPAPLDTSQSLSRFNALANRASWALTWERLWPRAVAVLLVGAAFLTVSWLGLWLHLPRWARIAGLAVFALALIVALFPFLRFRIPSRHEALARVDRDSAIPNRPASSLADKLAGQPQDPQTRALWNLHVRRNLEAIERLKVAAPSPRMVDFDHFAVRAAAILAVCASGIVAGPERLARIMTAFDMRTEGSISAGYRVDAWIDPPGYTGRPPVLLRTAANTENTSAENQKISAPVNSTIIVRASEGAGVTAEVTGGLVVFDPEAEKKDADKKAADAATKTKDPQPDSQPDARRDARATPASSIPAPAAGTAAAAKNPEQKFKIRADGKLVLRRLGRVVASFDIVSIPDKPPVISLVGEPRNNVRGSLTLRYKLEDDYGVLSADAEFSKPSVNGKLVTGRTLVPPPRMNLAIASGAGGLGEAETTTDLSESPWAGAKVTLTLIARDEGGNTGKSEPREIFLPNRVFVKPLARALVEQRRNLVLSPDEKTRVRTAFEALMIEPEEFKTPPGVYLGLYTIAKRLDTAKNDDDLRAVADLIWEMALRIEEGDLTDAERDLRAAQQALREALDRGASDEEIKQLMDQLRAAMDKFLREFAERQRQDPSNRDQQSQDRSNRDREITSQDLRSMLDQMERMARQGNTADARRMLEQLQNMLENLRTARPGQQNQQSREMNRALNQLDQMMRDQQALRDRTFRESQRGQQDPQQNGQQNQQGDQSRSLQQQQEALRRQLENMQKRMQQFGMQPPQGFGEAEREMREAEQQLGRGQQGQGRAAESQGRALEQLRRGAQALAQQMQRQPGQGEQAGPGDPFGRGSRESANPDPLGRDQHNRGDHSRSLYDPPGAAAAQRAQRILEELRRRLSDPNRPPIELDYLERLLRRY